MTTSDRPAEVCPKCQSPKEPASYRHDCNSWKCLSDFGVTKDGEFTQSLTCQLLCANQTITRLAAELQAAQGKLAAIEARINQSRTATFNLLANDITEILRPAQPAPPAGEDGKNLAAMDMRTEIPVPPAAPPHAPASQTKGNS